MTKEQTEFDKACDVFYDKLQDDDIKFTKEQSDNYITPALEEFAKEIKNGK